MSQLKVSDDCILEKISKSNRKSIIRWKICYSGRFKARISITKRFTLE